jgi:3-deoxy-7-phosphoheptulonate synthase
VVDKVADRLPLPVTRLRAHPSPDVRIVKLRPLLPPAVLQEELPVSRAGAAFVVQTRRAVSAVLAGASDRIVAIVGPCSIHDVAAAKEYAARFRVLASELAGDLLLIMRVYFEKPRTTVGWKGLINDPRLDGSFRINEGLRLARGLLVELAEMGVAAGCEFLDPISPQVSHTASSYCCFRCW